MSKQYKVYLLIFPNGKKYCGYTSQSLKKRWDNGNGYKKCPLVYKAIQKYGWNNIEKELLYTFDTSEEGLKKEKEIIELYNLTNPEYGYNLHEGGYPTGAGSFLTEEGRKRISEANKKRWADPEYKKKMSEKFKLHPPTRECIEKGVKVSSENRKGKIPSNAKPVLQIDPNSKEVIKIFPSASHAAREVTGNSGGCTNILKVCKNQRKIAYGYYWRFKENDE